MSLLRAILGDLMGLYLFLIVIRDVCGQSFNPPSTVIRFSGGDGVISNLRVANNDGFTWTFPDDSIDNRPSFSDGPASRPSSRNSPPNRERLDPIRADPSFPNRNIPPLEYRGNNRGNSNFNPPFFPQPNTNQPPGYEVFGSNRPSNRPLTDIREVQPSPRALPFSSPNIAPNRVNDAPIIRPSASVDLTQPSNRATRGVDVNCLQCLCQASTGCDIDKQCVGNFCGPYLISWPYWADAGRLGSDYATCALNPQCAEATVKAYMDKFARDCNNDGVIDCEDYAVIHKHGPQCAPLGGDNQFWNEFRSCRDRQRRPTTPERPARIGERETGSGQPSPIISRTGSSPAFWSGNTRSPNDIGHVDAERDSFNRESPPIIYHSPNYDGFDRPPSPSPPSVPTTTSSPSLRSSVTTPELDSNTNNYNLYNYNNDTFNSNSRPTIASLKPLPSDDDDFNAKPPLPDTLNTSRNRPKNTTMSEECLSCICEATSQCDGNYPCYSISGVQACGPYQITLNYWIESGKPGYSGNQNDYINCATNMECARKAVNGYIKSMARDCNNDGVIDCVDYAAIHKYGKAYCDDANIFESPFWNSFQSCYGFE